MTRPSEGRFHIPAVKFYITFLLIFIGTNGMLSQKVVRKALLLPHITTIQIDAERFSLVRLETVPGAELKVQASMEGEYQKDIGIEIIEDGNTLHLAGFFQPYFEVPNDKLSAHKVVAITLFVQVPEDKVILLYGSGTRVHSKGVYRELEIVLDDGNCTLERPEGKIRVTTHSGNIVLEAESGKLVAQSKYGSVQMGEIPDGSNFYRLESIKGKILVERKQ